MSQRIAAKNASLIFAGVRSMGYTEVSRVLGCSETTVCELTNTDKYKLNFHSVSDLLARMELKVVNAEMRCYDPQKIKWLIGMAKEYMRSMDEDKLEFDDE